MTQPVLIITQTFPPRLGGMELVMQALAQRFGSNGHQVQVLTDHQAPSSNFYNATHIHAPKLIRSWCKRLLAKGFLTHDSIVICDSWKSMNAVPRDARNIILLAHGQEYLNKQSKSPKIRAALDRARLIIASSDATAKLVMQFAPHQDHKIHVIAPTYMLKLHPPKKRDESIFQILSLARLEKRKGLAQSMEALAHIQDKLPAYQWHIAGNGPERTALEEQARRLGLEGHVVFHGHVDEANKQKLLAATDLFLMPSYQEGNSLEGFGIVYAEAASYAIPSVGGMAGGAREAVLDGTTGWSVDGSSSMAIAKALQSAILDDDERVKRGRQAQQYFAEKFDGNVCFDRFYHLAKSL